MAPPSPSGLFSWLTPDDRRAAMSRSLGLALFIFAANWVLYGVTLLGAVAALPWWLNWTSSVLNGFAIGFIFILGHDASHGAFVSGRGLNKVLARVAFIPSLHAESLWDLFHNRVHHGYANLKGADCVWVPMSKAEYDAATPLRRLIERIYRGPLGPLAYYLFGLYLPRLVFPFPAACRGDRRRHLFDAAFVTAAFVLTLTGIGWLGLTLAPARPLWLTLVQGWLVPFAIWNYAMGFSIYLHHTHPQVPWFDDPERWSFYNGSVRGTTHVDFAMPALAPVWQSLMHHTAHHMLPAIPVYRLEAAQAKLLAHFGEDVTRYRVSAQRYWMIMRACKLYDFERNGWTDFKGRPTAPPIPLQGRCDPARADAPRVA